MSENHFHFCPVCRRDSCGHLYRAEPVSRDAVLAELAVHAKTPLDMGAARFAADVLALFASTDIITPRR